mmetsp:Transcript_38249/g.83314  ORF Transcript_38249/g.83314 Transcript_38249/m.83314 type:complete len:630 (+) Transcript_38249:56-1945(+)
MGSSCGAPSEARRLPGDASPTDARYVASNEEAVSWENILVDAQGLSPEKGGRPHAREPSSGGGEAHTPRASSSAPSPKPARLLDCCILPREPADGELHDELALHVKDTDDQLLSRPRHLADGSRPTGGSPISKTNGMQIALDVPSDISSTKFAEVGDGVAPPPATTAPDPRWARCRGIAMCFVVVATIVLSSFLQGWSDAALGKEDSEGSALESILRYGSIPVIAAIIGYGTNVVALQMMFYPIEFMGYFPDAKIGCGLDLPLFGWQGVIPMKRAEMAEISVDLMTQRLIQVGEIFSRLDPDIVASEVGELLPEVISECIDEAGRKHCPKLWEHMPASVRQQIEDRGAADSKRIMSSFLLDMQKNIQDVFDLKHCVVERMVSEPTVLINMFLTCGKEEFVFIRISGFYLGFFFGLFQMTAWMFVAQWWILPLCGVFVGYFTNVIALKLIFLPVVPRFFCGGRIRVQGLFLQRQRDVSAVYAHMTAETILTAKVLMRALTEGPRKDRLCRLLGKHVSKCMEDQAAYYKPFFLMSMGAETWVAFREGVCAEFWQRLPLILDQITDYTQKTLQLEETLRTRLEKLPAPAFERLLHAVFEQDEIKLILVGAILGAIVGFLQALYQTPEQLGIR